jgi:lipid-binding SYLF domain-containing protein
MMKMMKTVLAVLLLAGVVTGSAFAGWDPNEGDKAKDAVQYLKKNDPSLERFFSMAHGYVVFPDVYKGGFLMLGGGHGKGYVYELGRLIGRSSISQLNVGPQLGGQSFTEIIFFKDKKALTDFQKGNFEISAQMTAVVVTSGIATNTDYSDGVAIFVLPKAGVMADATIGGQKFSYEPIKLGGVLAPQSQAIQPIYSESVPQQQYSAPPSFDDRPFEKADQGSVAY